MMGVVWLGPHTFKEFISAVQGDSSFPGPYEVGGPDAVAPGDTSYATVILPPGHVALACWVVGEDGKTHVVKGMMAPFEVVPARAAPAAEPRADISLTLRDYAIEMSGTTAPGRRVFRVENQGPGEHDVELFRMEAGATMADLDAWFHHPRSGNRRARPLGGMVGIERGHHGWFTADLAPGDYVLLCWITDEGVPHYRGHGMIRRFHVGAGTARATPPVVTRATRDSLSVAAGATAPRTDTLSIAFTHVGVVDVEHGRVLRDRTILIGGNRIREVGPSARVRVPPGARVVDASGKFLIPGLWDMHVHALRAERAEWMFPLFIAAGVTGIRDTGSPLDTLLLYRARVGEGRMLGPRIVGAGPLLDAPPGGVPVLTLPVGSPAAGRHAVDSLADAGVDFIKVYNGLSRESFFAIMEEAKRRGVRVIGHVPRSVTALEASAAGLASIEHLTRVPQVCVPDSVNRATTREWETGSKRPGMTQDALDSLGLELGARRTAAFDEALCEKAGERFAQNGTWQVPTLEMNLHWARGFLDSDTAGTDTLLRYVPAPVRAFWDHYRDSTRALPRIPGDVEASWYRLLSRVIRALHRGGDGILAGTDTDGNDANIYGVPGAALHSELEALVRDAGLTPREALQAATLEPARFLHATDSLGTISPGKLADAVLLAANPLEEIRNARRVVAVVVNGRYLDRQALDAMLDASRRGDDSAPRGGHEVASLAYTFPPEYAPQDAIWLGWSEEQRHHPVQVEMIRALLPHVAVRVMVRSDSARSEATRTLAAAGIDTARIGFVEHPLATNWIRDSGPRFLSDGRRLAVADFAWNGYGYPAEIRATFGKGAVGRGAIDNDIATRMKLSVLSSSIVAEGGALDVSNDVMLAYRQTAMERNPGVPIEEIEREYLRLYGKKKIVWLTRAPLSDRVFSGPKIANYFGWGANGHIDEFVRFVNDSTIAIAQIDSADAATNPLSAADREILQENLAELRAAVNVDGRPFHIVTLPVPGIQHYMWTGPLSEEDKRADAMGAWYRGVAAGDTIHWVPAVSYLNFVITNGVVLAASYWHEGLPQSERRKDELVRATLERLFPDRQIVQIDPLPFNWSGGGMHCSTQQQPRAASELVVR